MVSAVDESSSTETTTGVFTRQSVPGELTLTNFVPNPVDTTPPSQITDFRVEDIIKSNINGAESLIYTLEWTAVGSDMDIGQGDVIAIFKSSRNSPVVNAWASN